MKISKQKRAKLYEVIHDEIVTARIRLKLSPKDDVMLAQVESEMWDKVKSVLGIA